MFDELLPSHVDGKRPMRRPRNVPAYDNLNSKQKKSLLRKGKFLRIFTDKK